MTFTHRQLVLPLSLCVLTQVLYASFSQEAIVYTAREMLFGGTCAALAVSVLLFGLLLVGQSFGAEPQSEIWKNVVCAFVFLALLCGAVQVVLQQVQFYVRQFGAGTLWVLLLAVAVICLHSTPNALVRCARLLLALLAVAVIIALLGLIAQSNVHYLSDDALTAMGVSNGFWAGLGLYPDYLAVLYCKQEPRKERAVRDKKISGQGALLCLLALPFFAVAVQVGVVLCAELIFGVQEAGVGGFEFLRSWAFLNFSRFDGVIVLLWLLLAYFRLRFLACVAWSISPFGAEKQSRKAGQVG